MKVELVKADAEQCVAMGDFYQHADGTLYIVLNMKHLCGVECLIVPFGPGYSYKNISIEEIEAYNLLILSKLPAGSTLTFTAEEKA